MKHLKQISALLVAFVLCFVMFSVIAVAGTDAGGTGTSSIGQSATGTFNVLDTSGVENSRVGYRFSWIRNNGSDNFSTMGTIDIFDTTTYPGGNYSKHVIAVIENSNRQNLNKLVYKNYFNSSSINMSFTYGAKTTSGYNYEYVSNISNFTLPSISSASTVKAWLNNTTNQGKVLNEIKSGSSANSLLYSDYLLMEPLYAVKIATVGYTITPTEMALLQYTANGKDTTGPSNWSVIYNYTNMYYPRSLILEQESDHEDLGFSNGSSLTSRAKATTIINNGYGVGVTWNHNSYGIKYVLNGGTLDTYDGIYTKNDTKYQLNPTSTNYNGLDGYSNYIKVEHPTKTGYTFNGWKITGMDSCTHYYWYDDAKKSSTSTSWSNTSNAGKSSYLFYNLRQSKGTVTFTANWTQNSYSISYDLDGGSFGDNAKNSVYTASNGKKYQQNPTSVEYDGKDGYSKYFKVTAPTKTGYSFAGWKVTGMDSCTHYYWYDDANKTSTATSWSNTSNAGQSSNFYNLRSTSGTVKFTAVWTPNKYTVEYYIDGTKQTSLTQSCTYSTSYKFKSLPDASTGKHYTNANWHLSSATGTAKTPGNSFSNLSSTNGATVKLYATTANNTYTVEYYVDGTKQTSLTQSCTYGTSYKFKSLPDADTGKHYTNTNWHLSSATGTAKTPGNSFSNLSSTNGATVKLYATTANNTYTVEYYVDGTKQTSLTQSCTYGTSYKYAATPTASSVTGYVVSVSAWWSGNSSTSKGTQYTSGASFSNLTSTNNGVVKRYAYTEKTPITYYVKYNGNGATSGSMSNSTHTYDKAQALTKNAFVRKFTVTFNYNGNGSANTKSTASANFDGWAKSSSASVTYTDEKSVKNLSSTQSAVVNLYAKWTDASVPLPTPTRTGYVFSGWYTAVSGGTKVGDGGTEYTSASNITLYARWTPITYIIRYNANGGTGTIADQTLTYDVAAKIKTNSFEKQNSTFIKWNTKADGTGTDYDEAQTVKNLTTVQGKVINLYAQWEESSSALSLVPIVPNADYRETTSVITAFKLVNSSDTDCIPDDGINVVFRVYKNNTVIKTVTKTNVVVPKNEYNLLYFKWTVPELSGENIKITGEIVDGDNTYGNVSRIYSTCEYTISATSDTQYEASAPSGFSVPSLPSETTNTASWKEWVYSDGAFVRKTYTLNLNSITATIKPAASANSWTTSGKTYTKSGYAFEISATNTVTTTAASAMYVKPQYAVALFPEFGYSTVNTKCRTLELVSSKWVFRENSTYGRVHFTPLWYPDGNYSTAVVISDCWTPAGMVTRKVNTNALSISGSAYDDWWID